MQPATAGPGLRPGRNAPRGVVLCLGDISQVCSGRSEELLFLDPLVGIVVSPLKFWDGILLYDNLDSTELGPGYEHDPLRIRGRVVDFVFSL